MDVHTVQLYMGEDIETLPREKLLEVINCLLDELDSAHKTVRQIVELNKLTREVRRRDRDASYEFWDKKLRREPCKS